MNWKLITLAAGLILTTSLTACSTKPENSTNQVSPSPAGDAMSAPSGDAMKKDGDAMKNGDAMKKDGDAMKKK